MLDLSKLNEAQRNAVTWNGGPVLVLAGPGSGKTYTITNRILYLLESGVPPSSILVITFTKEAAQSMQSRFYSLSKSPFQSEVQFGTFHSVFFSILRQEHPHKKYKLIKDSQKKLLIKRALKESKASMSLPDIEKMVTDEQIMLLLSQISYYKNTGDWERSIKPLSKPFSEHFKILYDKYLSLCHQENLIDFDDMLSECKALLEKNPRACKQWSTRFQHILIDEFQDTNPIQYLTIKLLSKFNPNIFAVGDDDQSIYGFRGADPSCMKTFVEDYQAQIIYLNTNYRSRQEIVEKSLLVINENRNRFVKDLFASEHQRSSEIAVTIRTFADREEQIADILQKLVQQHAQSAEDATVGILFRTNAYMQNFAVHMLQKNIPFEMKERIQSIYKQPIPSDVTSYLTLTGTDWSVEDALRVINKPPRGVSREAILQCHNLQELIQYYEKGMNIQTYQALLQLQNQLLQMKRMPLHLAVTYLYKAMSYEKFALKKYSGQSTDLQEQNERMLRFVLNDVTSFTNISDWLSFQQEYEANIEKQKSRESHNHAKAISLMTVHGSKGLEFDRVIIPDCNEGIYPHGKNLPEDSMEEERRIFYVAMTRAKKYLELSFITGNESRPRYPSIFLRPILQSYSASSTSSSNSQLSRYSSNASATCSYSSSSSI